MATEESLVLIFRICSNLSDHESMEVRKFRTDLWDVAFIIFHWHQPKRVRNENIGYTCFDAVGREILNSALSTIKFLLRPICILLRKKGIRCKVLNSVPISHDDVIEIRRCIKTLRRLVMAERLKAYIPYMLRKFLRVGEWKKSRFAKLSWEEVDAVLSQEDEAKDLEHILFKVSAALGCEVDVLKEWIHLGAVLAPKDLYVARLVKDHEMCKLSSRVFRDESQLEFIASSDDVETRAYRLAFTTFRDEWFLVLTEYHYELTDKARLWLSMN